MILNSGSACASMTPCTPVTQMYPRFPRASAWRTTESADPKSIALTPTPSTLIRRDSGGCGFCSFICRFSSYHEFAFNPAIGWLEPLPQTDTWLPAEHAPKLGVVAVTATYALRLAQVMTLDQALAS